MTLAHPITQPAEAWQYNDFATAPAWVRRCCTEKDGEIIHDRQSGRQIVNRGEYLVRDLDGGVTFYSMREFERGFRR